MSPKNLVVLLLLALLPSWAAAQEFEFRPPPSATDPTVPAVMRDLAVRVLPVYEEPDTDRYLTNLAALQLVAGDYTAAYDTRRNLQDRLRSTNPSRPVDRAVLYDIYARARAIEASDRTPFPQAFTQAFKEVVPKLNDRDAHAVTVWLATPRSVFQDALQKAFDRHRAKGSITFPEAVDLVWTYLSFDAYRSFSPLVEALDSEDDSRRYLSDEDVVIKTPAGARIHATVVRPANASAPLPALLKFTIDGSRGDAKASAAHGYVGIVAYTRGKKTKGSGRVTPFEHDGEDARAVIRWITKQAWSDGRVGMYGDGYSGFAAWSAARRAPSALKAIATSSPTAPGISFPMTGNIFHSSAYRWSAANTQRAIQAAKDDAAQWRTREQAWYKSGKPYRAFERLSKKPDAIVRKWLNHPSYDGYWQKMIPFQKQFAGIDIPVLTTTGYYADGAVGALYYFDQHLRHRPEANHTLVVGPYDDRSMQEEAPAALRGYPLDAVARVNLTELRYQWFDSVLKGAPKPPLLKDRVNLQVMGANEWRHAPSLAEASNGWLRFYWDAGKSTDRNLLSTSINSALTFVSQTVKLADRSDAGWTPPLDLAGKSPSIHNAVTYVSEPLEQAVEFDGLFAGRLDFTPNKMDLDLNITLYELLSNGSYVQLSAPYAFRASYAGDRVHRKLLRAGERQQLPFTGDRITSRRLQAGSRVVMVLGVNKRPDQQINYGTGKAVNEESIADARTPLKLRWYSSSYIDIPVRK